MYMVLAVSYEQEGLNDPYMYLPSYSDWAGQGGSVPSLPGSEEALPGAPAGFGSILG